MGDKDENEKISGDKNQKKKMSEIKNKMMMNGDELQYPRDHRRLEQRDLIRSLSDLGGEEDELDDAEESSGGDGESEDEDDDDELVNGAYRVLNCVLFKNKLFSSKNIFINFPEFYKLPESSMGPSHLHIPMQNVFLV